MDFTAFQDPHFDTKQWINEALKSAIEEHNVQEKATDLFLQIQSQMKDVMLALDRTRQDAMITVPRVLREVEALKADAVALGTELDSLHTALSQVNTSGHHTIARLVELDRARKNANAAANALQEAVRWSNLVNTIDELLETGELDQACCTLEGMEQCLTALTSLPDYSERAALVERHKNSLEALIAPQMMHALDRTTSDPWSRLDDMTTEDGEAKQLVNLLHRIGREVAAKNYYANWLKSQLKLYWEKSNQTQRATIVPTLHRFVELMLPTESPETPVHAFLLEDSSQSTQSLAPTLLVFYASVLRLFEHQLQCHLFGACHPIVLMTTFAGALNSLRNTLTSFVFGSSDDSPQLDEVHRLGQMSRLLKVSFKFCSLLGDILNSQFPDITVSSSNNSPSQLASEQLALSILSPFGAIVDVFGRQLRQRYEEELGKIQLNTAEQQDFLDGLAQTISSSFRLVHASIHYCFSLTMGMGLPYLLSSIQFYWVALLAKWTVAIDRSGEHLTNTDTKTGHNQTSGFVCALRIATLTGELSLKTDYFVDVLQKKSADFLSRVFANSPRSPLFGSGLFPTNIYSEDWNSISPSDWALLSQLALTLPSECSDALRSIGHPCVRVDKPDSPSTLRLQTSLNGLHRTNVTTCRAAVLMVRRVALTPIRQFLQPVPTMPIWSTSPENGEPTLPDLAYLPQDYITRVGQYLFVLFEYLEPYMSTNYDPESNVSKEPDFNPGPSQSLAECLHLGNLEATGTSVKLTSVNHSETDSHASNLRRRIVSLSLASRKGTEMNEALPVFRWFENFVSGAACDLLVKCLLHIGDTAIARAGNRSNQSRRSGDAEGGNELGHHELLTPHGAKQLETDLGYFQHLLDDLGLTFPGHLQALRELISCPTDRFASLSASRPPAIVDAIARLRGL